MTSVIRNRSKSRSKKTRESVDTDDKIDQIMKDITLRRPRNPYTQFVLAEVGSFRTKNKEAKIDLQEFNQTCAEKWKKMKEGDKKKYLKQYEEEKVKYKSDIELVRHYLFRDFNDTIYRSPTAYRIFLNEKLREGFEQGLDPKEVRKDAGNSWVKMTEEEKQVYINKKKENDNWFLKAEKISKVNPIALFIQRKIQEAKDQHKEPPTLKEIAPAWKKLSKAEKKSYEKYAQEINEEKEKLKDIYDIVHGIKPKKPTGPFQQVLKEKKGQKPANGEGYFTYWKTVFDGLSDSQKKKYVEKAQKAKEKYDKKMLQFQDKVFDMPKKPLSGINLYVMERLPDLRKAKPNVDVNILLKQIGQEWREGKNMDQDEYLKKAEKDKKRFKKQLKEFQKMGYYTKTKTENEEEEDRSKKSKKKRSSSKASTQKTKKNHNGSDSDAKSKRSKSRSKSKSKKSQKAGNTKKSKK